MRQLQILETGFRITKYDIPLCCQIFFWDVIRTIRATIPEYSEQQYAYDNGIIECPECLTSRLKSEDKN